MGAATSLCGGSNQVVELDVDTFQSHEVDKMMKEQKMQDALNFKLLCLGAGEGGKSTIVKQLTFLHASKANNKQMMQAERQVYASVLHGNTIQCMATLVREAENFGYLNEMTEEQSAAAAATRAISQDTSFVLDPFTAADITLLWRSEAVQKTWARRSEFWHLENSEYYFDNVSRFAEPDFEPTEEDMVMARKRTTGVQVTDFTSSGLQWSVVDVGGQRSERRKWIHCFDNVKAILFVVNLLGYVNVLFEDKAVNRMQESLDLFEKLMKEPVFADTPVFLCMNKKDLFERELERKGIECCFPEYTGPQQLQPSVQYIAEQYQSRLPPGRAKAIVHLMAARVRKDVQYTFDEIKSYLVALNRKSLQKALKHAANPTAIQNTLNTAIQLHGNLTHEGEKRRRGSSDQQTSSHANNNNNSNNSHPSNPNANASTTAAASQPSVPTPHMATVEEERKEQAAHSSATEPHHPPMDAVDLPNQVPQTQTETDTESKGRHEDRDGQASSEAVKPSELEGKQQQQPHHDQAIPDQGQAQASASASASDSASEHAPSTTDNKDTTQDRNQDQDQMQLEPEAASSTKEE